MISNSQNRTDTKTIYINGRFLEQKITGVQRSACEILNRLDSLGGSNGSEHPGIQFVLVVSKGAKVPALKNIAIKRIMAGSGQIWEQIILPIFTAGKILLNLGNTAPIFHWYKICTICDASIFAVPESFSFQFRLWYTVLWWINSRTSRAIITISEFSKDEIVKYLKISQSKVIPIYLGCDHILKINAEPEIVKKKKLPSKKYILIVGSLDPRKNLKRAVMAAEKSELVTVIAGGGNLNIFNNDSDKIMNKNCVQLGYVTDPQLKALYENAFCLLYPSIYEGFGFPPLEAMLCGCPVLASGIPVLTEVLQESALFFDPYSIKDISDKISQLYSDDLLRNDLIKKGKLFAGQYNWQKTANLYMETLEKIVGKQ